MAFPSFSTPQPQQPQPFFQPQQQQQQQPFKSGSLFPQQPQQQQQQQQFQLQQQPPQQHQQQLFLFTNEKAPANYSTRWADLHPDSQKFLLQIEERILEYRDESQRLDQCSRLYDSSVSNEGFELDASHIVQELGGISTSMERQRTQLQELMVVVKDMLRNTEVAVRSFMILRPRFLHQSTGGGSSVTAHSSQAPGGTTQGSTGQSTATSIVPVYDFYRGLPKKPSPFLQQTITRFEKYLTECRQWIEELEQLLLFDIDKNSSHSGSSLLHSLPKVMANVHDFFVHVAAKVESIHQYVETMKTAYLVDQRRRGDNSDPFLEADRRETAKLEAAAKRVHPTLHLPTNSQPSTQAAGLLTSAPNTGTSVPPQTASAASGGGLPLLSTPSSTPMSSSLFATPSTSAPASSFFGATPQMSTPSPFVASTPSLFSYTASAFGSTPTGGSLFSTPFASGAATSSGASFGATTKSTRPKTRTARR